MAISYAASEFFGNPSRKMLLIGITGTKGKTTSSFLIKSILEEAGKKTGLIGTVCSMIGEEVIPANLTTPDPVSYTHLSASTTGGIMAMWNAMPQAALMNAPDRNIWKVNGVPPRP